MYAGISTVDYGQKYFVHPMMIPIDSIHVTSAKESEYVNWIDNF